MTSLDEPRSNYRGVMGVDQVTGRYQPQFPRWKTNVRLYCVSLPIVFFCMLGAFFIMLCSIWAKDFLINMKKQQGVKDAGLLIMVPSLTYSVTVFIMNCSYRRLATWLTEWENHRTQSQFDRHRVTKLVLFEFVSNFMSLFYIAFYIQDMAMLKHQLAVMLIVFQAINNFQEAVLPLLIKYYGERVTKVLIGVVRKEELKESDHKEMNKHSLKHTSGSAILDDIPELESDDPRVELAISEGQKDTYERDGLVSSFRRAMLPPSSGLKSSETLVCNHQTTRRSSLENHELYLYRRGNLRSYKCSVSLCTSSFREGTYDDYLEMFIQFGYVFLFSAVYPMATFWAVVNNVLEIRADAFKLCRLYQRPVTKRVKDIGAWQRAFEAVGAISIMTNCGLLCLSPQLRRLAPNLASVEWVLIFVFLEHVLLGIRTVLHLVIADRPEWVRVALARINHMSKQALKNERMLKNPRHLMRRCKTVQDSYNQNS